LLNIELLNVGKTNWVVLVVVAVFDTDALEHVTRLAICSIQRYHQAGLTLIDRAARLKR